MPTAPNEVTQLLRRWTAGDNSVLDELVPLVHGEVRRLARQYLKKERADHTLQTSDLMNEAYLRLFTHQGVDWNDRAHFFAVVAQIMRRVLIDHARSYQYLKRGAGAEKLPLDEVALAGQERASQLIALDDALKTLAAYDQRKSQIVELRFFGGLTIEETAEVLKVSPATVKRELQLAKLWLHRMMSEPVS